MSSSRFEPSSIKNKLKREEVSRQNKESKGPAQASEAIGTRQKQRANDPAAKKVGVLGFLRKRLAENVPRTLDNTREFDPSLLTADPSSSTQAETAQDLGRGPLCLVLHVHGWTPRSRPRSSSRPPPKATKATRARDSSWGRIAGWAAGRGFKHMCVVNEDTKKPSAANAARNPPRSRTRPETASSPASGTAVGRMFQTLFPPLPEFQGRQVVTLHNQRDFLFFRRHREIGPRFTLKLRSMRKGIPAVQRFGDEPQTEEDEENPMLDEPEAGPEDPEAASDAAPKLAVVPPQTDEYLWTWKPELETTRRTFFL
ncbi:hypothetical protein C8J57DRAFT_1391249 [Mycena rebaudengoi]|nr:hypothetical protein C8J57DRAFT_1391249 [Mycena rebaudengoi]